MGFTRMTSYPEMQWHNYFCPQRGDYFVSKLYAIDPDPNAIAWFVSNIAPVALSSFSGKILFLYIKLALVLTVKHFIVKGTVLEFWNFTSRIFGFNLKA